MIIKHGTPSQATLVELEKAPEWATGFAKLKEEAEKDEEVSSEDVEDSED